MSRRKRCDGSKDAICISDIKSDIDDTFEDSTFKEFINESDVPNPEDAFTYLQGLNSGNLMQFSQQSAIQELMKSENLTVEPDMFKKKSLNILPCLEEHDKGGYKFQIKVGSPCKKGKKTTWVYSERLNKAYLCRNAIYAVEACYRPKRPAEQLRVRVLLCFAKRESEPVLRCQNHISDDAESRPEVRRSLLRCENTTAQYCGQPDGKLISDRLSIIVPLSGSVTQETSDRMQKQTIALKFTCQNSCIGRKETSLLFLLENLNDEILAQRVMNVKICCCPKRDNVIDERNNKPMRTVTKALPDRSHAKKKKCDTTTLLLSNESTEENSSSSSDTDQIDSSDSNSENSNDRKFLNIEVTSDNRYRLVFEVPDDSSALLIPEFGERILFHEMARSTKRFHRYTPLYQKMKEIKESLPK